MRYPWFVYAVVNIRKLCLRSPMTAYIAFGVSSIPTAWPDSYGKRVPSYTCCRARDLCLIFGHRKKIIPLILITLNDYDTVSSVLSHMRYGHCAWGTFLNSAHPTPFLSVKYAGKS